MIKDKAIRTNPADHKRLGSLVAMGMLVSSAGWWPSHSVYHFAVDERAECGNIGDVYLRTGIDQDTKLIPTFMLGKRSANMARRHNGPSGPTAMNW